MRFGDLSNVSSAKIYVTFDETVCKIGEDNSQFYELIENGEYEQAINTMLIDIPILNKINWLSVRKGINIFIVTWMGQGMAEAIEEFFNDLSVPIRGCLAMTPTQLGRITAQDESVIGIFDSNPDNMLKYGFRGKVLNSERDLL